MDREISRRRLGGLAVGALGVAAAGSALGRTAVASAPQGAVAAAGEGPEAILAKLVEGNRRFMAGQTSLLTRRRPEDFAGLAEGQAPVAAVVACADSRVAPELVFDQGVGDLFVVRVAGNVVSDAGPLVKGSLEFAVAELGVRLILVMGHGNCGALKATIAHLDAKESLPGSIEGLVDILRPAVRDAIDQPGDRLENVTRANVRRCVERVRSLDPILEPLAKSGELKVVGAVYELKTGRVNLLE
jgi:carbonic anhydrase